MNIILVGMSGSGKTSIGSRIKEKFNMNLIDTDEEIKKETNKTIENIFKEDGEEFFRDYETKILNKYKNEKDTIFATGGGIILREENRDLLKQMGTRILLKAEPETLMRNLKNSQEVRPLLKDDINLKIDLENMMEKRRNMYLDSADYTIDINDKSIDEIVDEIVEIKNLVQ